MFETSSDSHVRSFVRYFCPDSGLEGGADPVAPEEESRKESSFSLFFSSLLYECILQEKSEMLAVYQEIHRLSESIFKSKEMVSTLSLWNLKLVFALYSEIPRWSDGYRKAIANSEAASSITSDAQQQQPPQAMVDSNAFSNCLLNLKVLEKTKAKMERCFLERFYNPDRSQQQQQQQQHHHQGTSGSLLLRYCLQRESSFWKTLLSSHRDDAAMPASLELRLLSLFLEYYDFPSPSTLGRINEGTSQLFSSFAPYFSEKKSSNIGQQKTVDRAEEERFRTSILYPHMARFLQANNISRSSVTVEILARIFSNNNSKFLSI